MFNVKRTLKKLRRLFRRNKSSKLILDLDDRDLDFIANHLAKRFEIKEKEKGLVYIGDGVYVLTKKDLKALRKVEDTWVKEGLIR